MAIKEKEIHRIVVPRVESESQVVLHCRTSSYDISKINAKVTAPINYPEFTAPRT